MNGETRAIYDGIDFTPPAPTPAPPGVPAPAVPEGAAA